MNITDDTPIAMLTVGQLKSILASDQPQAREIEKGNNTHYVYGYAGIARLFNCSIPTAARIKLSGKIDGAYKQIGRKIVVDSSKALELAGKKNGGRR